MKRSPLNRVSKKRQRENVIRRENLERAWGARPWSCWLSHKVGETVSHSDGKPGLVASIIPPCYGEVNAHEIVKRSQGGSITDPSNMIPLCNFHNGWVETADRDLVWSLGLVRSNWE
jgi:hypothetical protein